MARSILSDAERLAWERFPQDPDPDVIGVYFTLADGEVDELRRLPTPAGRLATAIAVAAIRWLGFVPAELEHATSAGVQRLATQLDVDIEQLAAYDPPERTAREHRQRAAQLAHFRDPDACDIDDVEDLLIEHALSTTRRLRCCAPRLSRCATASSCAPGFRRSSGSSHPHGPAPSATPTSASSRCSTHRRGGRWTRCA